MIIMECRALVDTFCQMTVDTKIENTGWDND